mmetsp:Transcript_2146/g.4483  ORF Transcript_2146/g.4483 Transcript_2146/m.4483 type:complete len:264 (-) Transcript_2146:230-1021(-)
MHRPAARCRRRIMARLTGHPSKSTLSTNWQRSYVAVWRWMSPVPTVGVRTPATTRAPREAMLHERPRSEATFLIGVRGTRGTRGMRAQCATYRWYIAPTSGQHIPSHRPDRLGWSAARGCPRRRRTTARTGVTAAAHAAQATCVNPASRRRTLAPHARAVCPWRASCTALGRRRLRHSSASMGYMLNRARRNTPRDIPSMHNIPRVPTLAGSTHACTTTRAPSVRRASSCGTKKPWRAACERRSRPKQRATARNAASLCSARA